MKKILSAIIAAALATSTFTAFANNPADLPDYNMTPLKGEELTVTVLKPEDGITATLDFGVVFEAQQTLDEIEGKYYERYAVDFELEFDKDVYAIPAGQYDMYTDATGNQWVPLSDENGIKFEANKPARLMQDYVIPMLLEEEDADGRTFTYRDVLNFVNKFKCGVKLVNADFKDGVTATLKLCMYETTTKWVETEDGGRENIITEVEGGAKYVIGDIHEFTYGVIASDTDEDKVAKIENAEITTENVEQVKEVIETLDQEAKNDISAETVKAMVEATGVEVDTETKEVKAYSADPAISVAVEAAEEQNVPTALAGFGTENVYEIKVFKTEAGNTEEVQETAHPVLIAVPLNSGDEVIRVVHVHDDGRVQEITNYWIDEATNILYYQMSEFSYTGIEKARTLNPGTAKLSLVEVPETDSRYVEGKAKYDIKLIGADNATIKNFVSGEFTITVDTDVNYGYVIEENYPNETTIWLDSEDKKNNTRNYGVKLEGFTEGKSWTSKVTGTELTLGTLTLTAVGEGVIALINVETYRHDASNQNKATLITEAAGTPVTFNIVVPTREVKFNVEFVNSIEKTDSEYTNMMIELAGTVNKKWNLGNDVTGVKFDVNTCTYTVTDKLPLGEYTVTVSGAGYRTVDYHFEVKNDMVLDFWNNVKEKEAKKAITATDKNKVETTFLAGDIVNDNFIDINDLSAVVSYFGYDKQAAKAKKLDLTQYDLNRDGKVNSKDVAYVLVSWNK